ncbi:unnamed protein product [Leptosia nina]|uniref:Uncharacterized protein n=1 Tax=Leptosia nina TaxID=320188 RepID=A0AAV1IY77_9NEOP
MNALDTFTKRGFRRSSRTLIGEKAYSQCHNAYRRFLLNTSKIDVTFFNGESFQVLYNFDATRRKEDSLLINWDTLTPLFGGVIPKCHRSFVRLERISNFVEKHIHLDKCKVGMYNFCSCTGTQPEYPDIYWDTYDDRRSHHYCSIHVRSWLYLYLKPKILLQESEQLFYEAIQEAHVDNPNAFKYYTPEVCRDTDILLESARSLGDSYFVYAIQ